MDMMIEEKWMNKNELNVELIVCCLCDDEWLNDVDERYEMILDDDDNDNDGSGVYSSQREKIRKKRNEKKKNEIEWDSFFIYVKFIT